MPLEAFTTILNANKVNVGKAEVELLQTELDPQKTGNICYGEFLNAMFLTQLYIKEAKLYYKMRESDFEGKGGVTIGMLNEIRMSDENFKFPQNALSSVFKQMLGQDIGHIDPECIIDTEQFIKSLRGEFVDMAAKTLSR